MKHTFLTLTLAAQLAAAGAYAQTSDETSDTSGSSMMSGSDSNMMSKNFGSDWSSQLKSAMLAEDGTDVRSESELASEWESLSEDDKDMIRRDCMMHMQRSDGETGMQSHSSDSAMGSSDMGMDSSGTDSTSDMSSSDMVSVSGEQMQQICDATSGL